MGRALATFLILVYVLAGGACNDRLPTGASDGIGSESTDRSPSFDRDTGNDNSGGIVDVRGQNFDGFIEGFVRDSNGAPVTNVRIAIYPWGYSPVLTDLDGKFKLDRSTGDWHHRPMRVVARAVSRRLASVIEITPETRQLDVTLASAIALTGIVVDSEMRPVSGALARIIHEGSRNR